MKEILNEIIAAEHEVLGRILIENKLIYKVNDLLDADDFKGDKTRKIYEAMKMCSKENKPIETALLMKHLKGSNVSIIDITNISMSVASSSNIEHYVGIVKEASSKRKLETILKSTLDNIDNLDFKDITSNTIRQLYGINSETTQSNHVNRQQLMENVLDYIQKGIDSGGESVGMKTGWNAIDKPLKGFNKGDLTLLGARPSMGKTVFSLNLSNKLTDKYKVLFFELEMNAYKLGMREVSAHSKIPLNRLYEPHTLNDDEISKFMDSADKIARKGNLIVDDTPRISLDYIREKVRFIKEEQGLDVVILDHIGLIKMDKGFNSRNEWIGEVSATLKAIAKEFDVAMIILSQLNRSVEMRADKRPMLSDLRDSGNLEQDADAVIFLYREGYYYPENVTSDVENLEVIIAKNRDGMVGTVNMAINLKLQLVTEIYK